MTRQRNALRFDRQKVVKVVKYLRMFWSKGSMGTCSLMDRILASDAKDAGSIPVGCIRG